MEREYQTNNSKQEKDQHCHTIPKQTFFKDDFPFSCPTESQWGTQEFRAYHLSFEDKLLFLIHPIGTFK